MVREWDHNLCPIRLGVSPGKSSPAGKFCVADTAMGFSIPENLLFYLYSHNVIDAKYYTFIVMEKVYAKGKDQRECCFCLK